MRQINKDRLSLIAAIVCLYIVVVWTVYRFRHPDLSETQLFLDFWEAMTWQ